MGFDGEEAGMAVWDELVGQDRVAVHLSAAARDADALVTAESGPSGANPGPSGSDSGPSGSDSGVMADGSGPMPDGSERSGRRPPRPPRR
ncbi:hypothetical protein NKH77_24705 [Streptomyces sp. M19]